MSDLTITSGAQWRKQDDEGVAVELPSGNVAKLRTVSPLVFIQVLGDQPIPDLLSPVVAEAFGMETPPTPETSIQSATDLTQQLQDYKAGIDLLLPILQLAMVAPRIVEHPTAEDEIGLAHLEQEDLTFILSIMLAPTDTLRRFRTIESRRLEPLQSGEALQPGAESDHERAAPVLPPDRADAGG